MTEDDVGTGTGRKQMVCTFAPSEHDALRVAAIMTGVKPHEIVSQLVTDWCARNRDALALAEEWRAKIVWQP